MTSTLTGAAILAGDRSIIAEATIDESARDTGAVVRRLDLDIYSHPRHHVAAHLSREPEGVLP